MSVPPESVSQTPPAAGGSAEDRNLALLTHLSGILFGFLVPLIVWLIHKDNTAKTYVTTEAKEALNFQLTILIGYVVCWVLMAILIGFVLMPLLWLLNLVFCILAAVQVSNTGSYRYPLVLRLIS
ncbi:MAG TPA: DUF4870 domain-containing protein [Rhodanobacteraceae bacterium]